MMVLNLGIFIPYATYKQWRFCFPDWITVSAFYNNKFYSVILQLFIFSCFGFSFFPDRNIDCLNLLLNSGADLDIKDHLGRSVVLRFVTSTWTEVTFVPLIAGLLCITLLLTRTVSVLSHWWELVLKSMSLTSQAAVLCTVLPLHSTFLGEEIFSEVKHIFIKLNLFKNALSVLLNFFMQNWSK